MPSLDGHDEQLALVYGQLPLLSRLIRARPGRHGGGSSSRPSGRPGPGSRSRNTSPSSGLLELLADECGQLGGTDTRASRPTAVADDGPHTVSGAHVGPRGVCARRQRRRLDQELPVCEVFDVALRLDAEG
ncbi:hypothetical protein AB0L10_03630 [Streptomyces flaveolus]|uniref:hypothetical protein n=1 Tax=Streptomyces flaveolus TaxID=67297 RepID=UPI003421AA81